MSNIPNDLSYASTHEWIRLETDNTATIGITDHAQSQLGDLVFVELPEVSSQVNAGEDIVVVESVKTASDVYSPLSGEIIAINQNLGDNPDHVNNSPYDDGWLYRIKLSDQSELDTLLSAQDYQTQIHSE
jgi:glycine cleavage system H protein